MNPIVATIEEDTPFPRIDKLGDEFALIVEDRLAKAVVDVGHDVARTHPGEDVTQRQGGIGAMDDQMGV